MVNSGDILVLNKEQKNWLEKVNQFRGITEDRRLDARFYYFGR